MDSACWVYAIVGRDTPLPPLDTAELALVPCREIAAVTGCAQSVGAEVTIESVLHHEAIVEAVRRHGPALPVRFGTVLSDATSVAGALAQRYELLAADLDRLGDKVELSLTALWAASSSGERPASTPTPARGEGGRYLYARAAERRFDDAMTERARRAARALDRLLGGLALERRVSLVPSPRVAVRTAYLLDPMRVSAFRAAVDALRAAHDELRILLTGPWPPYTFVTRAAAQ